MRELVDYAWKLALICALAALLLAGVNLLTKDKILLQAQEEEFNSVKEVLPRGERFEAVKEGDKVLYYKVYNKDEEFLGVAFKASAKGYSSIIEVIVGMYSDGRIAGIKILSQSETPGLGSRVASSEYLDQFLNKDVHGLEEVETITGATISSKAVLDAVKKRAQEIYNLMRKNGQ